MPNVFFVATLDNFLLHFIFVTVTFFLSEIITAQVGCEVKVVQCHTENLGATSTVEYGEVLVF